MIGLGCLCECGHEAEWHDQFGIADAHPKSSTACRSRVAGERCACQRFIHE